MVSPATTRNKKPAKAAARAASSRLGAGSIASEPRHMLSTMPLVPSAIPAHAGKGDAPPLPRQPLVYPSRVQRKLNLGSSSDALEAEAESTTDQVLRGVPVHPAQTGEPAVRRKSACEGPGAQCTSCAEEKTKLMRRAGGAVAATEAPFIVHDVINLPGQPLDSGARAYFERRSGRDLSGVRIHTDPLAAQSAQAVNALAYTVGTDIVFDRGRYAPQTAEGRRLLAHELTHVVQQGSGAVARRVQRDLVYGSDYKSPYKGDDPETRSAEAKTWYPATVDFAATVVKPSTPTPKTTQTQGATSETATPEAATTRETAPTPMLQPKLAVNVPGDVFEQEAERVADQVMRVTVPGVDSKCSSCAEEDPLQRKCAECAEEDERTELQRKESGTSPQFAPPIVHDVLRSPGRSLNSATRAFMEPRFGFDFSGVRVHDGAQAAESAKSVNALAYTVGNNVVFDMNQYQPGSTAGQRLLAHELTHVVQQSREGGLHLYRKELPDEEIPKDWPLPNPYTEGTEKCRIEEGDLKCYKVKCKQTEEDKTHCYYDGPYTPEPEKKPAQTPAAKQAVSGTDSKGQGYVVYEKEIRVGGTRPWRNNNPGNFDKPEDHPKNIGNDGRFLIFPDPATGKQELIDNVKSHGTSTIRSFITAHAPPSENPTETYITDVLGYMNNGDAIGDCKIRRPAKPVNDGTVLSTLSESEQTSFAFAIAREEGWCDVTQKKAIYNCQSSIPNEYKGKLVCP